MNDKHTDLRVEGPKIYRIDVQGRLDESWSDWLEGMAIDVKKRSDGSDVTTITGVVVDHAALYGILNRLRDLNLPLLSVQML